MRNLLLLAAAFGLATAANAQNTATTTQNGNANAADVTQTGNNTATVIQTDKDNGATVLQNGSNSSTISQANSPTDPTSAADGNRASTDQDGTGNMSFIDQGFVGGPYSVDGDAVLTQAGTNNESTISQSFGFYNDASVFQSGTSNESVVTQSGTSNATSAGAAAAGITQIGEDNFSDLFQSPQSNTARIYQDDEGAGGPMLGNTSNATQNGVGHSLELDQYGTLNQSTVSQTRSGGSTLGSSATIFQDGVGNQSFVTQTSQLTGSQTATVTQTGNGNTATVTQN